MCGNRNLWQEEYPTLTTVCYEVIKWQYGSQRLEIEKWLKQAGYHCLGEQNLKTVESAGCRQRKEEQSHIIHYPCACVEQVRLQQLLLGGQRNATATASAATIPTAATIAASAASTAAPSTAAPSTPSSVQRTAGTAACPLHRPPRAWARTVPPSPQTRRRKTTGIPFNP